MILNLLACALIYKPVCVQLRVVTTVTSSSSLSSSTASINESQVESTTSINVAMNEYYTAVAQSSPPSSPAPPRICVQMLRLIGGKRKSVADFLAVSAVNAVGHLAHTAFLASAAPSDEAALQLAAAEAAGCVLVPTISDLLSSEGSASVHLYSVVTAATGAVLLAATPQRTLAQFSDGGSLMVAFGLATGGAVGLETLVAVRVLGHDRLSASIAATLLSKGVAQLAVDLLFSRHRPHAVTNAIFYTLGICLTAAAGVWTAVFLFRRYAAAKNSRSRYTKTA